MGNSCDHYADKYGECEWCARCGAVREDFDQDSTWRIPDRIIALETALSEAREEADTSFNAGKQIAAELVRETEARQKAERERDEAREEIARLRERLEFDPGGSDKIDELEQALQFIRHSLECRDKEVARANEALEDEMLKHAALRRRLHESRSVPETPGGSCEGGD